MREVELDSVCCTSALENAYKILKSWSMDLCKDKSITEEDISCNIFITLKHVLNGDFYPANISKLNLKSGDCIIVRPDVFEAVAEI